MDSSEQIVELLTEIRDLQREHLDEYKTVTSRAFAQGDDVADLVKRQASIIFLYKCVLAFAALALMGILAYLIFVLGPKVP